MDERSYAINEEIRELENELEEKKEMQKYSKACYENNLYELLEGLFGDNVLAEKAYQAMEELDERITEIEDLIQELEDELESMAGGNVNDEIEREYWQSRL